MGLGRRLKSWGRLTTGGVPPRARRGGSRGDTQLAVDRAYVKIDRDRADRRVARQSARWSALRDQAQHLELTGRQPFRDEVGAGFTGGIEDSC